ncbi:phosphotransacetylase family protein [Sodalinema gerasimenkoae]|uniref:phosphotransacetylase family protein n=1 Tax=Sodalinema gerasimenkoae TaxID=2862348 RepID=UPI001357B212|nr:phosphotransacetylase family protein [Sodalinema gerasimenkoae]
MPNPPKYLIVGSIEPYSGKTSSLLGLAHQLQKTGLEFAIGQPLAPASSSSEGSMLIKAEVDFIAQQLNLSGDRVQSPILTLSPEMLAKRLQGEDVTDYMALVQGLPIPDVDLVMWEGPTSLSEGRSFDLSLPQLAERVDAAVLLVVRYDSMLTIDRVLSAKAQLGDRPLGIILNNVPTDELDQVQTGVQPFLERSGITVVGILPHSALLRSVSVQDVVKNLDAEVLCGKERLDLMIESIQIGAMSVNSAVKYFQQSFNTAIVTGGDRADIQLAALETATHCLILTGHHLTPSDLVLNRAEEVEIPVISVERDTLTTVELLDAMFGRTPVREPMKLDYIYQMAQEHLQIDRLLNLLELRDRG